MQHELNIKILIILRDFHTRLPTARPSLCLPAHVPLVLGVDEGPGALPRAPRVALGSRNQPEGTGDSQKLREKPVAREEQTASGEEREVKEAAAGDAAKAEGDGKEQARDVPKAPATRMEDEALLKSIDQLTTSFKTYIHK